MRFIYCADYHGTSPAWCRSPTGPGSNPAASSSVGGVLTLTEAPRFKRNHLLPGMVGLQVTETLASDNSLARTIEQEPP